MPQASKYCVPLPGDLPACSSHFLAWKRKCGGGNESGRLECPGESVSSCIYPDLSYYGGCMLHFDLWNFLMPEQRSWAFPGTRYLLMSCLLLLFSGGPAVHSWNLWAGFQKLARLLLKTQQGAWAQRVAWSPWAPGASSSIGHWFCTWISATVCCWWVQNEAWWGIGILQVQSLEYNRVTNSKWGRLAKEKSL